MRSAFAELIVGKVGPRCLGYVLIALLLVASQAQANLIRNPSFEAIGALQTGQGFLPSDWIELAPAPGADTYSNDGSYGLPPSVLGNFTGVTAFDGIRWIAGWSIIPETFGQSLTTPLTPGLEYTLSAFLHQAKRSNVAHPGTYEIGLAGDASLASLTVLGQFALTSDPDAWEARSLTFVAPAAAGTLPVLVFKPVGTSAGTAYPGLDLVSLTATSTVPEPSGLALLAIGFCSLLLFGKRVGF
jgi:hypothetical protein